MWFCLTDTLESHQPRQVAAVDHEFLSVLRPERRSTSFYFGRHSGGGLPPSLNDEPIGEERHQSHCMHLTLCVSEEEWSGIPVQHKLRLSRRHPISTSRAQYACPQDSICCGAASWFL